MLGAVFLGERKVELREFADPEPGPGEVVVAIRASGMCGSDLHIYRDQPGQPLTTGRLIGGHEPAGVVHAVGPGVKPHVASVGDRVMVHHYSGCGVCDLCRTGWPQMCLTDSRIFGQQEHGAHAPMMLVPASTLIPLHDSLSFEAGASIGCGTGTAWGGLQRLGDIGGATLAVFGQGPVGLSATLLAAARGARVIAIDTQQARLEHSARNGAIATVNPLECDVQSRIREIAGLGGVPLVFETSGASRAIADGLAALAPWGKICLVGLGGEARFPVQGIHRRQVTIMPSISMSIVQQRQCAQFVVDNSLDIDGLFSHRWKLDQAVQAYEWFDKQDAGKGAFVFDD